MIHSAMRVARALARRIPPLRRLVLFLRRSLVPATADLHELTPLRPAPSASVRPRLNLLVPAVAEEHRFGGINTALQFFDALLEAPELAGVDARIIVTDEHSAPGGHPAGQLRGWPLHTEREVDAEGRYLIGLGPGRRATFSMRRNDVFIASAWWTAYVLRQLRDWQCREYGVSRRPWAYLIQDYEPNFHAWGVRYWLAQSTYSDGLSPQRRETPDPGLHAVINSPMLARFFTRQGHVFPNAYCFDSPLHPALRVAALQEPALRKERILLVYGRPRVERNAFTLVVKALQIWSRETPGAQAWQVLSAGEKHAPVRLASGLVLRSLGKLSLQEYVDWLRRASVGMSLMCSPHPSYPPREMATFELDTVTLAFIDKPMDDHRCFRTAQLPTPEALAQALADATLAFDQRAGSDGTAQRDVDLGHAWLSDASPFAGFISTLGQRLRVE